VGGASRRRRRHAGSGPEAVISLDTSVLVRYLVGTPEDKARRAAALIEGPDGVAVSIVALVECAHVLRARYGVPKVEIVDSLLNIVRRDNVAVVGMDTSDVTDALVRARSMPGRPMPDALIVVQAQRARALPIATFDHDMRRYGLAVVEP
jgi:predicted nucleic acid-binding protein